jgi:hypothetical protein
MLRDLHMDPREKYRKNRADSTAGMILKSAGIGGHDLRWVSLKIWYTMVYP